NDNLLTYTVPPAAELPLNVTEDDFAFVVRNAVTGGITDSITFTIVYDNPNAPPEITAAGGRFDLNPFPVEGPRSTSTLVRDLIAGGLSDPDSLKGEAVKLGIAVIAADTSNGVWEYSTDRGVTWQDMGEVSEASALLLDGSGPNTLVRFRPSADFSGLAEFR